MNIQDFKELISKKEYRFLDFGCSTGSAIDYAYKLFDDSRPGLGLDINKKKIELARENGHDAIAFDILKIPDHKIVEFVTLAHFLEHLPSVTVADQILRKAVTVARKFVFIRQPFFDADGYLAQKGLKLYWSDWKGHMNKMTSLDFYLSLNRMKTEGLLRSFTIHFHNKVASSADQAIHPLSSPIDQHGYDSATHPPKNSEIQLTGVYREIYVLVHIKKVDPSRFSKLNINEKVIFAE